MEPAKSGMRKDKRPKQTRARKVAAHQQNAQKSTGPHNSSLTRSDAAKHGLLAGSLTELDEGTDLSRLRSQIEAEFQPVGEIEIALVEQIAFCITRLRRAALIEAECVRAKLHPPVTRTTYPEGSDLSDLMERYSGKTEVIDPGLPSRLSVSDVGDLQRLLRYETSIENKLYRAVNQLERLQRARHGDKIPAPAARARFKARK
jgi:hypothetical protein